MKIDSNLDVKSLFITLGLAASMSFSIPAWSIGSDKPILGGKEEKALDVEKGKDVDRRESRNEDKERDDRGGKNIKKNAAKKAGAAAVTGVTTKKIISNIKGD